MLTASKTQLNYSQVGQTLFGAWSRPPREARLTVHRSCLIPHLANDLSVTKIQKIHHKGQRDGLPEPTELIHQRLCLRLA